MNLRRSILEAFVEYFTNMKSSCGSEGSTGGLKGMGQALGAGSTFLFHENPLKDKLFRTPSLLVLIANCKFQSGACYEYLE